MRRGPAIAVTLALLAGGAGLLVAWSGRRPQAVARRHVAELADPARADAAFRELETNLEEHALEPTLAAAADPAFAGRERAIELLGALRDRRAVPVVVAAREPALREARAVALGRLGGDEAKAELLLILDGDDVELKFPVARAVIHWPDPDGALRARVRPLLDHPVPGLREAAADFLARHPDPADVPALIGRLKDDDGTVRQAAGKALIQIGGDAATAAVDSAVRTGAVLLTDDGE